MLRTQLGQPMTAPERSLSTSLFSFHPDSTNVANRGSVMEEREVHEDVVETPPCQRATDPTHIRQQCSCHYNYLYKLVTASLVAASTDMVHPPTDRSPIVCCQDESKGWFPSQPENDQSDSRTSDVRSFHLQTPPEFAVIIAINGGIVRRMMAARCNAYSDDGQIHYLSC